DGQLHIEERQGHGTDLEQLNIGRGPDNDRNICPKEQKREIDVLGQPRGLIGRAAQPLRLLPESLWLHGLSLPLAAVTSSVMTVGGASPLWLLWPYGGGAVPDPPSPMPPAAAPPFAGGAPPAPARAAGPRPTQHQPR